MPEFKYEIITGKDRPDLSQLNQTVTHVSWPEFMFHDPVSELFVDLFEKFPEYQFSFVEPGTDNVIVLGNCIPLAFGGAPEDLPDTGWDWALQKGVSDFNKKVKPNILSALQIVVANDYRGQGLSSIAVDKMKDIGRARGFKAMVAPVRPNSKSLYPLTPMERFIRWQTQDNLPFDPWLRVHAKSGAGLIKVCHNAMRIPGTIAQWEEWTQMRFPESGKYIVPGALNPVRIDIENDQGLYIEPNVWMYHPL
ncbi:MAG: GNAT family N-acetyltransferase [Candidatus Zixiibacteriota bacterium]